MPPRRHAALALLAAPPRRGGRRRFCFVGCPAPGGGRRTPLPNSIGSPAPAAASFGPRPGYTPTLNARPNFSCIPIRHTPKDDSHKPGADCAPFVNCATLFRALARSMPIYALS